MKKKYIVAIVVTAIVISGAAIATYTVFTGNSLLPQSNPETPRYNYLGGASVEFPVTEEVVFNDITGDYRPSYANLTEDEYEWIFGELPEFREDFFSITTLIYEGKITDYERISEEYWKQPEFYTGWFNCYTNFYPRNRPDMWAVEGYSFFPMLKEISVKKGSTITSTCFLRSGYGIETYQGFIVKPYFPEVCENIYGKELFKQPENVGSYLKPIILTKDDALYTSFLSDIDYSNVGSSDLMVVLEPTYSIITDEYKEFIQYKGFPKDWVRLITLQVEIDDDTPSGDYVIALDVIPPCFEINQEYYFSVEHLYYGGLYHPVSEIARSVIPYYQLVINVK